MTDQGKATGNEGPIEWEKPEWGFKARLTVSGLLSGPEPATEADLRAAGFVPKAELEAYDRAISEFDAWLGEQAAFFVQNPQVNRTFLDVAAKLMHTLRTVPVKPTPEPGEPVDWKGPALPKGAGRPVPAETAGEELAKTKADAEFYKDCLEASQRNGKNMLERLGQLQSALTRAEGRVRELEAENERIAAERTELRHESMQAGLAISDRLLGRPCRLCSDFEVVQTDQGPALCVCSPRRSAQSPLASSVVADEATTGEGRAACDVCKSPSCILSDDECREACAAYAPSPLTGEEGKPERQSVGQLIDDELEARGGMTPALAEGLAATFGTSTDLWLNFALANELAGKASEEGKGSPPPPHERCPKLVHSAAGQLRCVLHAGHSNCHSYDCQERHEAQRHLGKCLQCGTRLTNEPSPLTGDEGKAERVEHPYDTWKPVGPHVLDESRNTGSPFALASDAWCDHTSKHREAELSKSNVIGLLIRAVWQLARKVDALESRAAKEASDGR